MQTELQPDVLMDDILAEARNLVLQYSKYVQDKNLEGILDSLTEDACIEVLHRSLIKGRKEIGKFYEDSFAQGGFSFNVNILEEKIISEVAFINGIIDRLFTPEGAVTETITFHFFFILKKTDGKMRVWQARIARD